MKGDNSSPAMAIEDQGEAAISGEESSTPVGIKTLSPANLDICKLKQ